MSVADPHPCRAVDYDAGGEARRLWHAIWDAVEYDIPTFAVGPYPPYKKVKEFEAWIQEALRAAFDAGAASRGP